MPKVTFKNSGDQIETAQGSFLKDAVREKGWPIAFGCEDGVCGTCIIQVHKGKENLNPLSQNEEQTLEMMCMKDGEHRLCCQCKVNGDIEFEGM